MDERDETEKVREWKKKVLKNSPRVESAMTLADYWYRLLTRHLRNGEGLNPKAMLELGDALVEVEIRAREELGEGGAAVARHGGD